MRFTKVVVFLLLILGSFRYNFAQDSNTVYYRIYMEKKVSSYWTSLTKISSGEFKEGSGFIIPEAELPDSYPADFTMFQDLYDALVGGYFRIDYGALDKDIVLKLFIRNLDPETGTYKPEGEEGDTLFSYFEIRIWELPDSTYSPDDLSALPDSSYYPEDSSYYFNKDKYARLTLPKTEKFLNFLDSIGIARDDTLSFAYLQYEDWDSNGVKTDDWNGNGITVTDTPDSIYFKAIHLSKIGGGRGRIHKPRYNGGVTGLDNLKLKPTGFILEQNYPNPFNPSTTIQYTIPLLETLHATPRQVTLKVYDILGREVATLVNEMKRPGKYKVTFDGSVLPSGIYIYALSFDNQIKTRKMILMK